MANPGAKISSSSTQYFASPFQTVLSMEPLVASWNYTFNLVGVLVLASGLFLVVRARMPSAEERDSDKAINQQALSAF
jgi:hypothetical protein